MKFLKFKKLMFVYLVMISLIFTFGCSSGDVPMTEENDMKTICLDGVTYYYFNEQIGNISHSYMTVKFNRDSTVNTCDKKNKRD